MNKWYINDDVVSDRKLMQTFYKQRKRGDLVRTHDKNYEHVVILWYR